MAVVNQFWHWFYVFVPSWSRKGNFSAFTISDAVQIRANYDGLKWYRLWCFLRGFCFEELRWDGAMRQQPTNLRWKSMVVGIPWNVWYGIVIVKSPLMGGIGRTFISRIDSERLRKWNCIRMRWESMCVPGKLHGIALMNAVFSVATRCWSLKQQHFCFRGHSWFLLLVPGTFTRSFVFVWDCTFRRC